MNPGDLESQEAFIASSFIEFHTQESPSGEWIPMSESEAREVFEDWLAGHDAALIEGLADEVNVKRNDPGLVHLDVRYAGYYTGIRSGLESSETLLREKARQRREEKP